MTITSPERPTPASDVRIDLYISRNSPSSDRALDNLRAAVMEKSGSVMPLISIIDVNDAPLVAYREGITVTPTLVVTTEGVPTVMFGDLSDPAVTRAVLARLL